MNNLILGGAGFIGQHLAHRLLKTRQNRVTIIDNLSTGKINLDDFSEYKNLFEFIHADIRNESDQELMKTFKKNDRIFHFASSVGVEYIDKNPKESLFNSVDLNYKLISLFEELRNRHIVFSSTSEIYGEGPFSEDSHAHIGPSDKLRWGYATSKLLGEFLIRSCNFPYTIVRFFNVVGPKQLADFGMVLPKFIQAAKTNSDIIIHGDGKQIRSFCHIDDALDALMKVCEFQSELFNIGNDSQITIRELALKVLAISGSQSKIKCVPYEQIFSDKHGDIRRRVPDLTKIKTMTDYSPKRHLDYIIKDMLK